MRGTSGRWAVRLAVAITLLFALAAGAQSAQPMPAAPAGSTSGVLLSGSAESPDQELPPSDIHAVIDFERVVAVASSTTGSRMGLYWFAGEGSDSKMFVSVVEPTAADRESIATVAGSAADRVVVITAAYSQNELDGYVSGVGALLGPGSWVGIGLQGEGADARPGIDLGTESMSPEVRKKIEELVPADLLRLRVEPGAGFRPLTDRTAFPPYQAALANRVITGSYEQTCTSGFLMVGAYGYFGTTAGHCSISLDSAIVIGDDIVDMVRRNTYVECNGCVITADASLYSVQQFARRAEILLSDSSSRRVTGRLSGSAGIGTSVCLRGRLVGSYGCGDVTYVNLLFLYPSDTYPGAVAHYRADCFDEEAGPGDSGAPIYITLSNERATAVGMLSGKASNDDLCYSRINEVVAATGAEVATSG